MTKPDNQEVPNYRASLDNAGLTIIHPPVDQVKSFHDDIRFILTPIACIPDTIGHNIDVLDHLRAAFFYNDSEPPRHIHREQRRAIDYIIHERRNEIHNKELASGIERDWLDVTTTKVIRHLLNPCGQYMEWSEPLFQYPSSMKHTSALMRPKPDISFGISVWRKDPPFKPNKFDMIDTPEKLRFPLKKLSSLISTEEIADLRCGTGTVLLPLLIIERKDPKNQGLFACQNQLFGGMAVMLSAVTLAVKLLEIDMIPIVYGIANIGNLMELWAMGNRPEEGQYQTVCIDSFNLSRRTDSVQFISAMMRLNQILSRTYRVLIGAGDKLSTPPDIPRASRRRSLSLGSEGL